MSKTLRDFIEKSSKKGIFYRWRIFWREFWLNVQFNKEKQDNSWKGIKLNHTYYPKDIPQSAIEEYQFNQCKFSITKNTAIMAYLSGEYNKNFKTFKRYN